MSGTYNVDWAEASPRLSEGAREDSEWYAALARRLIYSGDQRAVDVGCGGAGMAIAMAAQLLAPAQVLAIDGCDEVLEQARRAIAASGTPRGRISLRRGDLTDLRDLVGAGTADLVWAASVVHHVGDQQEALDGLVTLLRSGGRLALNEGGLTIRRLPWDIGIGVPGLETRLHAAHDAWFRRMRAELPGATAMPYGWGTALRRAGLVDVRSRSTLLERPAPLTSTDRTRVVEQLAGWVERAREGMLLDHEDLRVWDEVLDPSSPHWLGLRDDLYVLEARTVHVGVRPG